MSDRQLRDEAMTLFLAGHDTTSLTLSWLIRPGDHPDIERGCTPNSVMYLVTVRRRSPMCRGLRFAEHVIKESMRLYPPAYAFGREALCDLQLGGYPIRRGQTVMLSQWVTHRDPRSGTKPEKFDPDRWKGERTANLPKFAYFPSAAARVCIGNQFSMLEATLIMARWRGVTVSSGETEPVRPRPSLTLRPERGIRMRLYAR